MKTKILSGLICCLGIFSANAQTITAPVGQSLTVTNPIDITVAGGTMNVPADGSFKIGGNRVLSTLGSSNLFVGPSAGASNTGLGNIFAGANAGFSNTAGNYNTFIGADAGRSNTTAVGNLAIGNSAGFNMTGPANMLVGTNAGYSLSTGSYNMCLGVNSGYFLTTGVANVTIGPGAGGSNLTTGSGNVFIGNNAVAGIAGISNSMAFGNGATVNVNDAIVLGNGVNVGIGNSAPTARLEVTSATGSGLKFTNLTSASPATPGPTGTNGKVLSVDGSGNVILVQITGAGVSTSATGPVAESWKESDGYLYNNSTNGVVIKGTGLDGNSLIVKGGVLSKEVNVKVEGSESWPDYVFKPNYKRMTLGEVEKFISTNGHLPNIPSATEMAKTGNNLGQTDVKLLEKVEELTLYLLDMKKANDAQAAELKALKQQVSKLRKK